MNIIAFSNYIKMFCKTFKRYKNWIEIIKLAACKGIPSNVVLRDGTSFKAPDDGDLINLVNEILFNKCYNPESMSINEDDVVVDIGANIGVFTVYAAKKTRNFVYAFEPFPDNYKFINLNIYNNHLTNVKTYQTAVSDKIGIEKLYQAEIRGGHLLFDHNIHGKLKHYIEVPTTTLKQIMDDNKLDNIDFLKMDCEGSEGAVFLSTPIKYLKRIKKIAMEFHDNVSKLKHNAIAQILIEAGFKTQIIWDEVSPFGYLYFQRK